jgi:hypothetical protein
MDWRDVDLAGLAAAWLRELRFEDAPSDDDAAGTVVLLTFTAPAELQWAFIEQAVQAARTEGELNHIAAGPFEGLFGPHGADFIDQLEDRCAHDPKFARMTAAAWRHAMDEQVWRRVQAIQAQAAKLRP